MKLSFSVFQMVKIPFPWMRDGSRPLLLYLAKQGSPRLKKGHEALV